MYYIQEEIKRKLNLRNADYQAVQNLLPFFSCPELEV
jgi:hypothetical protein